MAKLPKMAAAKNKQAARPRSAPKTALTLLGKSEHRLPSRVSASTLETFPNRFPSRNYWIDFDVEDFTSLCPITRQPDFAEIHVEYIPNLSCIETKSLKFYFASYRDTAAFNEEIANRILDDLVAVSAPRQLRVVARFASRGGIRLTVRAEYSAP